MLHLYIEKIIRLKQCITIISIKIFEWYLNLRYLRSFVKVMLIAGDFMGAVHIHCPSRTAIKSGLVIANDGFQIST